MREMIGKNNESKDNQTTHTKKLYVRPKLVKADKLAQVTQGTVQRS